MVSQVCEHCTACSMFEAVAVALIQRLMVVSDVFGLPFHFLQLANVVSSSTSSD